MEGKNYSLGRFYFIFLMMRKYFSIVKRAYLWILIAITATVVSWVLFMFSAQFSEEFTGGISVVFNGKVKDAEFKEQLAQGLAEKGFPNLKVHLDNNVGQTKIKINNRLKDNEEVNKLSLAISNYLVESQTISSESDIVEQVVIGPSVGKYMTNTASRALGLWLLAMMIYMIFSFWTIRKNIAPGILATVVLFTSVLSISIPAGAYGIWMALDPTTQIDTVFIIAILTIIGYGINDVIIIFDRIRENMIRSNEKIAYANVFDESIRQTFKRSLGTSISTLLVLIAMFVFGTGVIQRFSFTVGVGVIVSFLSSIFVAASTAYLLINLTKKVR